MKTKKLIYGTLVGFVAMYLLGALIYGMLLGDYMAQNTNPAVARPMEQMSMGAIILANLLWAFLLALIIDWSGSASMTGGLKIGVVVSVLAVLSYDLSMYALTTMYTSVNVIFADAVANVVISGVAGALTGWVAGKVGAAKQAVA